jgi:hypothetical protein
MRRRDSLLMPGGSSRYSTGSAPARLNLGRDQILARLWELATLSHEATRGIIAGQIKALSMIVAKARFFRVPGPLISRSVGLHIARGSVGVDWRGASPSEVS